MKEIQSKKILGFKYLKRFRLSENQIKFENSKIKCDYLGLVLFGNYSEITIDKSIGPIHIISLMILGFCKLIEENKIEIYEVEDLKSLFFGIIKFREKHFEIKLIDNSKSKDVFLNKLTLIISYFKNDTSEMNYLENIMITFYKRIVGFDEEPHIHYKVFAKKILDIYYRKNDFIDRKTNLKENLTQFSLNENFSVKNYLEIKELKNFSKFNAEKNNIYKKFVNEIKSILKDYFYFIDNSD